MSNNNIIAEVKAPRDSFKKEFCENVIENDKTPKAINLDPIKRQYAKYMTGYF